MKVILFTDNLGAGGAQRQLVGLAVLLAKSGYDVKVLTYQEISFYKAYLDDNSIQNEVISGASNRFLRIPIVANCFIKERPDYVISYQEIPSLIACATRFFGCRAKILVSERSVTQSLTIKDRIRFNLYRFAERVIPNSYTQEQFLKKNYKWMSNKICTITNFVDLDYFSYNIKEKREVPLILVAASVWPLKNVLGLIKAVKVLADRGNYFKIEWYGIVNGHDEYLSQCNNLIKKLNVEDYIELLPKTKDIIKQYRNCDFFCLPSFYEGTPNVICEAMAVGRPIICSDVCDNARYITNNENGFLFDPKSSVDIALKLEKALLLTPKHYVQVCANNRKKAESMLSQKTFINKYLELITN